MKILILAQGKASRWTEDVRGGIILPCDYKQLLPLGDETVLSRTIKQIKFLTDDEPILIAIQRPFNKLGVEVHTLGDPTGSILQGILLLRALWMEEDDTLFILGDVTFSNAGIQTVIEFDEAGVTFFGRQGSNRMIGKVAKEIFALKVSGKRCVREKLYSKILRMIGISSSKKRLQLKLWDLYHEMMLEEPKPQFIEIDDYTDDLDSPEAYDQFYEKLLECVNADDKNYNSQNVLSSEDERRKDLHPRAFRCTGTSNH